MVEQTDHLVVGTVVAAVVDTVVAAALVVGNRLGYYLAFRYVILKIECCQLPRQ